MPTIDKDRMRASVRMVRDAFVAGGSPEIAPVDALSAYFGPGRIVAGYRAIGSEADPALLIASAIARGCRIALPRVATRSAPMRFLRWSPGDALEKGQFGLMQPRADAEELAPDTILTPLIAFDRQLNRLGQGAGYYDRAFMTLPGAVRIGVAWSVQEVESVFTDAWDVPLHAVITEREWITA